MNKHSFPMILALLSLGVLTSCGATAKGHMTGTVSQNVDAQACGTLQVLRNLVDGLSGADVYTKGFTAKDAYGNKITPTVDYKAETKALLANNTAVVKANVGDYAGSKRDAGVTQTKAASKKILVTVYNSADNFLSSSYVPALKYYAGLLNLNLTFIQGDGQNEAGILDNLNNLDTYDGYAFNMVKTNSGSEYIKKLGTANADKPLVWYNRQPSDPTTGIIDMVSMNYNAKTYYVGFDAAGGGDVQGKMITNYLATKTKAELDRDGDGTLGYVLCIGDVGHNDSKARTKGIRKALGTLKNDSTDPTTHQTGSVTVKDGTLKVEEIAESEMKGNDGSTWNADKATEIMGTWASSLGKKIDLVVSNNDGMAMGCLANSSYPASVPIFGYDANADALASIQQG